MKKEKRQLDPALQPTRSLLEQGDLEQAKALLRQLVEVFPQAAHAYELLGAIYYDQGCYEEAVHYCGEAIRLKPETKLAYLKLAQACYRQGRAAEALKVLSEAIAHHPEEPKFYLEAVTILRDLEALDEALQTLALGLEQNPEAEALRRRRLELLFEAERYEELIAEAQVLLRQRPQDLLALEFMAAAHFYLGELDKAAMVSTRLVALAPLVPHYHLRLGALCHELGDYRRAHEAYLRALELASDEELAHEAWEGLALLDETQMPMVMTLLAESPTFRRELQRDPVAATRERGFYLSDGALAMLLSLDFDLFTDAPGGDIKYY